MDASDVGWKHAEAYFRENPGELVKRMGSGKKLDAALRTLLCYHGDNPFREAFRELAIDVFTEAFYGEGVWRDRYREWCEDYARRRNA